jgi:tRNA(adenine34) deaminase
MTSGDDEMRVHEDHMRRALAWARRAALDGEVPVGAVVVRDGEVLGEAANRPIGSHDPTAHAEIVALRAAAARVGNYRLPGAVLYATIEPCTMCAGALVHARIQTVVYGAREPRAGAVVSTANVFDNPALNHKVEVVAGVLEADCAALLTEFFHARRDPTGDRSRIIAPPPTKVPR